MDNILCMKWGTKFGPNYVNTLAGMVRRHLKRPHRFICFTDDAKGLHESIEIRALPELNLPSHLPERGWRKLTMFGKSLDDVTGTALFLDLDVVILDSLDPFFEADGEFLIIKDWDFPSDIIGNSSVFRFEIGQYPDILSNFIQNREKIRTRHRNEQAYLSHAVHEKGILRYWDVTWCRSFKRSAMRPFPLNYFLPPKKPEGAKVIIFHGNPNPDAAIRGWCGKCGLRYVKPTSWIAENWIE
ncbi:MAG: hypothetical protein ACRCUY_07785 [Thermoguttaceae bacterium]